MEKQLKRTPSDKVIAGVCGGLAKYLDWRSDYLRWAYVLISILSAAFPGILVYLILWFILPEEEL